MAQYRHTTCPCLALPGFCLCICMMVSMHKARLQWGPDYELPFGVKETLRLPLPCSEQCMYASTSTGPRKALAS